MLLRKILRARGICRRFFTTSSRGSDSGSETCLLEPCTLNPERPQPAVVIVGAGVAGLSAAQRLAHCGLTNITVLEATDRPGGRVHSCWLGDAVVELGAQWILGACPNNSIYSLAAREGLLFPPSGSCTSAQPRRDPIFCTSDGRAVDPPLARAAMHTFSLIEAQAQALFSLGCVKPQGALLTFLNKRIQQEVLRYPEEQRYDVAAVLHGLCNCLRCWIGTDLACVSADQYGSAIRVPGGNLHIPLGFVGVLAPLLRDLPECSIRYCKTVENIGWDAEKSPRAVIRTTDGDQYPADYVLVTVSLGILKAKLDSLFSPCLPADKMEAIKGLGFGTVNKIFLEYSKPFWAQGCHLQLAWAPDELQTRDDWVKGMCKVEEVIGSRTILCVSVSGEEAVCMEGLSDADLVTSLTKVLRRFTGDPTLPFPVQMLRSSWSSDPYFKGSGTYLSLHSNVGQQCDLSAPAPAPCSPLSSPPPLLFAGEHTCPGHFNTVHGARLSGLREAERILQGVAHQQRQCKSYS